MREPRVLVIEDDPQVRRLIGDVLENEGAHVCLVANGDAGLALLAREPIDCVFTDLRMPGQDGLAVLKEVQRLYPEIPTVVLTGYASVESSVEALRLGASDYVVKPTTANKIAAALARAVAAARRRRENGAQHSLPISSAAPKAPPNTSFLAASQALRTVLDMAARAAAVELGVLIEGETGVGKESLARVIHRQSPRANGPFVRVTCGAIREDCFDAVLFGQVENESVVQRGLLEQANGGTLFLHDVAELPIWAQGKLCEVLQQGSFVPVGGRGPIALDVRVIGATRCDLSDPSIVQKRFFRRLFYLLNVVRIHIPPLRTRKEDIRVLAKHFLSQADQGKRGGNGRAQLRFSDGAWNCVLNYEWPGNAGELANVAQRAALLSNGHEISAGEMADLSVSREGYDSGTALIVPLGGDLKLIERHIVLEVIKRCGGNKAAAARSLGLHRKTLYRLMKQGAEPDSIVPLGHLAEIDQPRVS